MQKKIFIVLSVLLVLALLVSCAPQPTAQPEAEKPAAEKPAATQPPAEKPAAEKPVAKDQKYGLFMSHMTNAFTIELSGAVKSKADELKANLTIYDGGNDAAKQLGQVETAINEGISAIIIEPVSVDGIIPGIEAAKKANIPVITINQNISKPELVTCFVGVSHVEGGALEMKTALEAIGGKGNIAILDGPMGSDAQIGRDEGYKQVLDKNPDVKVAYQQTANWKTDEALKLVENWLQTGTELSAIVAENDGMALGALKAVEDAKLLDKVKIFGLDATPDALAAVKDGRMAATVSQSTTDQGLKGMEAAYKIVNGEKVDAQIIVGHTLITKDNVDKFIKPSAEQPAAKPAAADQKYGLFMSHMTNAFTIELSGAVKSKADELKANLTIYDGGNDAAKQLGQVETAINEGISAIIIEPVSVDGIIPGIEAAKKANIPVITINQNISKPELVTCFVGVSHVEGGALEMKTALEAIGGKGNIAILDGPMGSDAQIGRDEGYKQVLDKNPDVKVAYQQTANWKTDEALKLVENWLQTGTELSAIVAENDGMALGALKAVEDAKLLDKVKIFGLDATPDALAAVKDGRMAATVSQSTTDQGLKGMEAAYKIVNGEKVDAQIIVGHTLITKDNVDKFIK